MFRGPNKVWVLIYNISIPDFGSGSMLCNDFQCKSNLCLQDLVNARIKKQGADSFALVPFDVIKILMKERFVFLRIYIIFS